MLENFFLLAVLFGISTELIPWYGTTIDKTVYQLVGVARPLVHRYYVTDGRTLTMDVRTPYPSGPHTSGREKVG